MDSQLLELMVSPGAGQPLHLARDADGSESLRSAGGDQFPVRGDIPRFIESEQFVESFGFQWNRFEVRQPAEDDETFELKTGVRLNELAGLRVLDAGCGGGRYSRVCADHGAWVVGVDRSLAVEKARQLTVGLPHVSFVQADLTQLPFRPASFDLVFSLGVVHHSPDAQAAFRSIASMVKPGGRLSLWVYRRNSWPQEMINSSLRAVAAKMPRRALLSLCRVGAILGAVPLLNRTFNKIVNFSNHPRWENRVCDNFDWYSPPWQSHHSSEEIIGWFREAGFVEICELPPAKRDRLYSVAFNAGWIVGSGVNVTGIRKFPTGPR